MEHSFTTKTHHISYNSAHVCSAVWIENSFYSQLTDIHFTCVSSNGV